MARLVAARRRLALHRGEPVPIEAEPLDVSGVKPLLIGGDLATRLLQARERIRREQRFKESGDEIAASGPVSGGAR
jgi:hypothetical protein